MYSIHSGSYNAEYYNSLAEFPLRIKALIRLFKLKHSFKTRKNKSELIKIEY
jgi:hypothetical protein